MAEDLQIGHIQAGQVKAGHGETFDADFVTRAEVAAGGFEMQMRACAVVLHKDGAGAFDKADRGFEIGRQFLQ